MSKKIRLAVSAWSKCHISSHYIMFLWMLFVHVKRREKDQKPCPVKLREKYPDSCGGRSLAYCREGELER